MAIKTGQILHDARGFVVDRIQTGGVSNLNIPQDTIKELGNFNTVAIVRDIPDLSFDIESLDCTTQMEALVTNVDPTTVTDGQAFDFQNAVPLDVISPFRSALNHFDIVKGIGIPYLNLESVAYKFGVKDNAAQTFSFRGDSVYYVPGSPRYQAWDGDGTTSTFSFANTAIVYHETGIPEYALSVCVHYADGTYRRLFHGTDYSDTSANFVLVDPTVAPSGSKIVAIYGTATVDTFPQSVSANASVKPAAIRGKDIDVYIGTVAATPVFTRWTGVQSVDCTWKVTLDADQEFGNKQYVTQDYDVPDVSGSIDVKSRDVADLWTKIAQASNVPTNEVASPLTSTPLPIEIRISHPDTGDRVKTIYVPDARFTVPALQGKVGQKQEVSFPFASEGGFIYVYNGARP